MNDFDLDLAERLAALRGQGLYRALRRVDSPQTPHLRIGEQSLLNFSSNDYLGLANEPALKQAASQAIDQYGAGAGASRLICGSLAPFHQLEESLAAFKATEAALTFSSGYAAALGTIVALLTKDDIVILDKLVHACIVDAARFCGAKLRVFAHNDLNHLETMLKWADSRTSGPQSKVQSPKSDDSNSLTSVHSTQSAVHGPNQEVESLKSKLQGIQVAPGRQRPRVLVVTESVFSMDGDHAPLRELVALKEKYGAWLMVDEAHACGLYGPNRRGLAEDLGVSHQIEIQMGTLGKALGASGGFICGSRALIDYLVNRARTFIFSTAPVPAAAAAASAGVRLVQSSEGELRRRRLWQRVAELPPALSLPSLPGARAIIPILIGDETRAVQAAAALWERGILLPAIRYPTVARGQARLRLTLTAAHVPADIAELTAALGPLHLADGPRGFTP